MADRHATQTYGSLVPDAARYTPPEVVKGGWDIIKRHPLTAVDAYGLGILMFEVFNGSFSGGDQVGKTTNVPPNMQQSYKRLCNANPKIRLSPAHFVEQGKKSGGFFETPLIRLTDDIESLGLKNEAEREDFIKYAVYWLVLSRPCGTNLKTVNLTSFQKTSRKSSSR